MWLYSLFDEYWNLYHKVTFDGVNRLILINDGETNIDVQRDIYSSWKEWVLYDNNARYLKALDIVGGEPTVAGQRLDVTYFLINGWRIKPYPGSYFLNLIGNIFDVDGGSISIPSDVIDGQPNNININTNTSVIVRQVGSSGGDCDLTNVENQLTQQSSQLVTIENRIISIENMFNQPIEATLVGPQETVLFNIETMMSELWKLHGLDPQSPLIVSQTRRLAGDIGQDINTTGANLTQETTITRDP